MESPHSAPIGRSRMRLFTRILLSLLAALVITLLCVFLSVTEAGRTFENETIDWRLRIPGSALEGSDVVLVYINQDMSHRSPDGQFPIPRQEYASFIDGMLERGARVILLDAILASPDRFGPENDEKLTEALERHGDKVVLAANYELHEEDNPRPDWGYPGVRLYRARPGYLPREEFARACRVGHSEVVPDEDGSVRRMPLLIECDGKSIPALCLAAVMAYLEIPVEEIEVTESAIRIGRGKSLLDLPVDSYGCLMPRAIYRRHTAEAGYSLAEILDTMERGEEIVCGRPLESIVGGKVVLLGMGDFGISHDRVPTPWGPLTQGVEVNAAFVESILGGKTATTLRMTSEIAITAGLALAVTLSAWLLPVGSGLLLSGGLILGYLALTVLALPLAGIVLPVVSPLAGMSVSDLSVGAVRFIIGGRWRAAQERELLRARWIQEMLLPKAKLEIPGIDLCGSLKPCHEVAGDCYDFFDLGEGRLAFLVGDVVGKGLPAAMLMSNIQGRFRAEATHTKDPAEVVFAINDGCASDFQPDTFATMAYAILDVRVGRLTSCLGGHNPALVVRANGNLERLAAGGPAIGWFRGAAYEEDEITMESGDMFVFYTDGITEAQAPSGEFYDEMRLERVLSQSSSLDAESVISRVLADVDVFTRHTPAKDDQTILVLKIL
ncbi:MAG: SpoIIE family protein phosphatase [Candidatus Eisenbacteria bacterium]